MYGRDPYSGAGAGNNLTRALSASGMPVTWCLIALNALTFLLAAGVPSLGVGEALAFQTNKWPGLFFWTPLTWPLLGTGNPISLLFSLGWAYFFGGSIERAWGWRNYLLFLLGTAVITALAVWAGGLIPGVGGTVLAGLWVAMAPVMVAWSYVNRSETFSFMFLPIPGRFVGILGAVIAWFDAGASHGNPLIGLFALAGCAAAWWYVTAGRYPFTGYRDDGGSGGVFGGLRPEADTQARFRNLDSNGSGERRPFNLFRWWREYKEKKRFEEIMRRSGFGDEDEPRKR